MVRVLKLVCFCGYDMDWLIFVVGMLWMGIILVDCIFGVYGDVEMVGEFSNFFI